MEEALMHIVKNDTALLIPIILFLVIGVVGVVAVVFGTMTTVVSSKESERTRREIAAYIAEGSMTPEDGQRLIEAGLKGGNKKRKRCA